MYCLNCGSKLDDDALFCTNCGAKVESVEDMSEGTSYLNDAFRQERQGNPVAGDGAGNASRNDYAGNPFQDDNAGNVSRNDYAANAFQAGYGDGQNPDSNAGGPDYGNGSAEGQNALKGKNSGYTAPDADFISGNTKNGANTPDGSSVKPPKKGKGGLIALIIVIAVLCVAIIAGAVVFVLVQRNKNEKISAFSDVVESFEQFLDSSNYSSVQDEVSDLMERCQQAIEDKSVKSIDALEQEIDALRAKLEDITAQIGSLEELKTTYQSLIEEKYYVPDELKQYVDDIFANLQTAIDNGAGDQLDNLKSQMEEMLQGIADKDMELINSLKSTVDGLDLSEATDEERSSLENYVNELQQLIDSQDYKQAIEKAQAYVDYANEVAASITKRQEESRKESEEEAAKNDYICPDSASRYLTESDLAGLSDWELLLARNEIYARHGRKFDDPDIRAYFESKSWYKGTVDPDDFNVGVFNDYELKNIEFIQAHEK